jgi:hypothetical protein
MAGAWRKIRLNRWKEFVIGGTRLVAKLQEDSACRSGINAGTSFQLLRDVELVVAGPVAVVAKPSPEARFGPTSGSPTIEPDPSYSLRNDYESPAPLLALPGAFDIR